MFKHYLQTGFHDKISKRKTSRTANIAQTILKAKYQKQKISVSQNTNNARERIKEGDVAIAQIAYIFLIIVILTEVKKVPSK